MTEELKITQPYWSPYPAIQQVVQSLASQQKLIVEIGPGRQPFSLATEFVDWQNSSILANQTVHCLDINKDPLPYANKSVDFIYCRHTLEDIYNPLWLCQEMSRIAKSGYIETPAPIAECCRGVDASSPPWRGYHHHRYLVWNDGNILIFLPKYPIIEYLNFGEEEENMIRILNGGMLYWNTYFFWNDQIEYKLLQHDQDFRISFQYQEIITKALQKSAENSLQIALKYGLNL